MSTSRELLAYYRYMMTSGLLKPLTEYLFSQAKERLIASLQSGEGGPGVAKEAKLEEVRLEKEHLLAQLNSAQQQIENLKADIQVLY